CVLLTIRTQGCGCSQTPGIPCALFSSNGALADQLGRRSRRGNAKSCFPSLRAQNRRVGKATASAEASTSEGGSVPTIQGHGVAAWWARRKAHLCPPYDFFVARAPRNDNAAV